MTGIPVRMLYRTLAFAVVLAGPLAAQSRGGTVRGVITSAESRAPVSGARIGVSTPARAAITPANGAYVLRDLPAGRYELLITALGRTPVRDTITVADGRTTQHDVVLRQGSLMLSSVI